MHPDNIQGDIEKEINSFLDSMPQMTRITVPDLVIVILARGFIERGVRAKSVQRLVRSVVQSRNDVAAIRQKGICKTTRVCF